MAGRTSSSVGVGIWIAFLSVLSLGMLITAMIFFGNARKAQRDLQNAEAQAAEILKPGEGNLDDVRRLISTAASSKPSRSLAKYLIDSQQQTMEKVTGSRNDSFDAFSKKLAQIKGADTAPLLQLLRDRDAQIASLTDANAKAEADRKTALADKQAEVDRVKSIQDRHQATVDALNKDVGQYKTDVEKYRSEVADLRAKMDAQVAQIEQEARQRESELRSRADKLQEDNLVLQAQVQTLRGERNKDVFKGQPEYALVDARIVGINAAENQATISIGRRQKASIGMPFSVYADAGSLRPDDNGMYPRGKAGLEIINVDENSSTCRILWETKGNPVVAGDVAANPLYDPNKTYKFLAFGNFDANGDGVSTAGERADIRALIEAWGGQIVDDLTGDVDFLVLGERPLLPPRPDASAPIEVMQEYIRRDKDVQRYDRLRQQAEATSIPILNENRLYTLLGRERLSVALDR
ncbi:MAG: hypothetical protein IT436_01650 [Phycisphaerales bacterium]|nr:hypothetical protein [Phycisphaerales bacterium]